MMLFSGEVSAMNKRTGKIDCTKRAKQYQAKALEKDPHIAKWLNKDSPAGKGDSWRPVNIDKYLKNYDAIQWKSKKEKK